MIGKIILITVIEIVLLVTFTKMSLFFLVFRAIKDKRFKHLLSLKEGVKLSWVPTIITIDMVVVSIVMIPPIALLFKVFSIQTALILLLIQIPIFLYNCAFIRRVQPARINKIIIGKRYIAKLGTNIYFKNKLLDIMINGRFVGPILILSILLLLIYVCFDLIL
ncbi:hypothetical protein HQ545_06575 [Candidatus Woesearchaeota archaeon]|nr:hypothetical protein [Candidatus Woesearchaeota archaeon]